MNIPVQKLVIYQAGGLVSLEKVNIDEELCVKDWISDYQMI